MELLLLLLPLVLGEGGRPSRGPRRSSSLKKSMGPANRARRRSRERCVYVCVCMLGWDELATDGGGSDCEERGGGD